MKISEIIELTHKKPMKDIAKEQLNIGEKPARLALKNAGGVSQRGKSGWTFEGPEENLDKSIYDFTKVKAITKPKANVKTNDTKNKRTQKTKNESEIKYSNVSTEEESNRRRASFDIDKKLLKELKIKSVVEERSLYELVEEAIRQYLK